MILYNLDLLFAVWSSLLSVVKTLITTWHIDKKKSHGVNFTSGEFLKNKLVSQTYLKEETI